MSTLTVFHDDGSQVQLVPRGQENVVRLPLGRKFGRLKHDYEIYGVSRPTHNGSARHVLGLPETVKVLYPVFMPMTLAWQRFAADLLSYARYRLPYDKLNLTQQYNIKVAYRSVYIGFRAFTNRHGWDDGYADYINNVNTGEPPMEQETINSGGNIVELLSSKMRLGGEDVYKVRTLDGTKQPPSLIDVNSNKTPWYICKATNSQRVRILDEEGEWTGKWIENIVEPFPQNGGYDVPVAFMGKGPYNYIRAERVEVLLEGAPVPTPYNYLKR